MDYDKGIVGIFIMIVIGIVTLVLLLLDNRSEVIKITYRNTNGNTLDVHVLEQMVKNAFPSNEWQNVEYDISKYRAKIEFSNN